MMGILPDFANADSVTLALFMEKEQMRFGFCGRGAVLDLLLFAGMLFQGCAGDPGRLTLTDAKVSTPEPVHIKGSARNLSDGGNASVSAMYEARVHGSIHPHYVNDDSIDVRFRISDYIFVGSFDYAYKDESVTFFTGGG